MDEVNGPVSLPQAINPLNQSLIPRNCPGPQLLVLKRTKLGFGQTEQMKVSIRKQNSVKIKENSEKYITGLNQFNRYKDLITWSSVVTEDNARRVGSLPLTSVGFRSDI